MPWSWSRLRARLPFLLHRFGELVSGERVEHVFLRKPGAAGLQDTKADLFHVRDVMAIGVNDDLYAALTRHAQVNVTQVETVRIGVMLHGDFVFGRGIQD